MDNADSLPIVSILTPSFNQGRWLGDALDSVRNQRYPHIEHLVMDGGSTDETVEILEKQGSSVRWWSEPDRGQSHAINKAFARSRGDIIGWLNSDDAYFTRSAVASVVNAFARNRSLSVVYGHAAVIDGNSKLLHFRWVPPFSHRLLLVQNFIAQPAAFIRRSSVGAHLVDESYDFTMDRELWLRLAAPGRFGRVQQVLAVDRLHQNRKSVAGSDEMAQERLRLDGTHEAPSASWVVPTRKAILVGSRLFGTRLITRARADLAFPIHVDPPNRLLARQIATRRRKMQVAGDA